MICYSVDTVGQLSISDMSFVWASLSLWTARGVNTRGVVWFVKTYVYMLG